MVRRLFAQLSRSGGVDAGTRLRSGPFEATSLSWAKELERLEISEGDIIEDDEISLFPEFLAQIAGYVRSPGRQADLHMLVDVGAGTMDATTFNVHVR